MTMKTPTQTRRVTLLLILAIVFAGVPSTVSAQNSAQLWSTVATAGVPDESSQALVNYTGPYAYIKNTAPNPSTVTIRYRVAPVDGLFFVGCKALKVNFLDDGDGADIRISLRQVNINTGETTSGPTFNSSSFPTMRVFQTQTGTCVPYTFDFGANSYWIEAVMTRSLGARKVRGNPGITAIQITTSLI